MAVHVIVRLRRPARADVAAHAGQSEHAKQDKHQSDG
jgi:hypothetical protein